MKANGFYLSIEAIVSMTLLALLLSIPVPERESSLSDLHAFKKENDFLLLWVQNPEMSESELLELFSFAFPGKSGILYFDEKKLPIGKAGKESISAEAFFFDSAMRKQALRIVVFK